MALRAAITTRVAVKVRGISPHHLLRRTQFFQFANSKIVGGAQHGCGSCFLENLPANKKAARFGGCSDFLLQFVRLSAILPPPASCRS